ncbi:MAG: DUF4199 domain-containing protein [Saprospiraceae bacterium]
METLDKISTPNPVKKPYTPIAVRYGIYIGLAGIILALVSQLILDPTNMGGSVAATVAALLFWVLGAAVTVVMIALAAKHYRDVESGGYVSLGTVVMIGLVAGLVAGAIQGLYSLIDMYVINPGQLEIIKATMEQSFEQQDVDDERAGIARVIVGLFTSPLALAVLAMISKGISGLFWGLIAGLFVQKERPKV